jgi:hypothetical protein
VHRFAASSEILPRAVPKGGETNVGCNGCCLSVATAVCCSLQRLLFIRCNGCLLFVATAGVGFPLQALIVGAVRFGYKRCGL